METTPIKKSQMIQNQFTQVCAQIGDLMFKLKKLEQTQDELQEHYRVAVEDEKEVGSGEYTPPAKDAVTTETTEQK